MNYAESWNQEDGTGLYYEFCIIYICIITVSGDLQNIILCAFLSGKIFLSTTDIRSQLLPLHGTNSQFLYVV